ncbi:DNA-directed RNA polymerase I subunit rpa49 [Naganishia albida]|nr:DNA-directed RNA polymerase I subunit rpa49 [Naganishia albida]
MMSTNTASSRKRKLDIEVPRGIDVLPPTSSIGPVFVNFPAIRPGNRTSFQMYKRERNLLPEVPLADQQTVVACETQDVEFYSINKDLADGSNEQFACEYLPAIYDPSTQQIIVQPAIPTYVLAQRVKRTKLSITHVTSRENDLSHMAKRDVLGEAFGTRKAKSRIRANERNKVDATGQDSVRDHLMVAIEEAARSAANANVDTPASAILPPPNTNTTDPSEVYPLSALIPAEEAAAIDWKKLSNTKLDAKERVALFPFRGSRWLEQKMRLASELPEPIKKQQMRALYYISCMRQFQKMKGSLGNSSTLHEKMNQMPRVILAGLLDRFTETAKGSSKPVITPAMENKLLAWQFALRLSLENWSADIVATADDLQMTSQRVGDIFKSLGCTVDQVTAVDRERLGIRGGEAKNLRKAVLQAPPVFPKERKRGPAKR